ncbi:unnamed protein product [Closterium sp. Yama58-4]|nr:unnamed protein product [Closterium sp. Yama58-4]
MPFLKWTRPRRAAGSYADRDSLDDTLPNVIISVPVPTPSGLHPARLATFPVRPYRAAPAASRVHPADHCDGARKLRGVVAERTCPCSNRRPSSAEENESAGENESVRTFAKNHNRVAMTGGSELSPLDGVSNARNAHDARDFGGECHSQCLKRGPGELAKECTVCLSDFNEMELVRSLPCTHRFHVSCIDHWLADRTTCPVCRVDLSTAAAPDVTVNSVASEMHLKDGNNSGSRSGPVSVCA